MIKRKCKKCESDITTGSILGFCKRCCPKRGYTDIEKKIISERMKGNKWNLGRIKTKEVREHMKGHSSWNKGMKMSKEYCDKLSELRKGEKNPSYIKDRSLLTKAENKANDGAYMVWSIEVKKRDNYKCRIDNQDCCGRLESHHILNWKDYPELRYEINNGITLCHYHHPRKKEEVIKLIPVFQSLVEVIEHF